MSSLQFKLHNEDDATWFARRVAKVFEKNNLFKQGVIVYLQGDLGVGKSHFARGFIQAFLPKQKVKSPTYTIVESYNFSTNCIYHLDLYRLCDPEELEYLAIRDLFSDSFVALIEWPANGSPILPAADVEFEFSYMDDSAQQGREVVITARSLTGQEIVDEMTVNGS